MDQTEKLLQTTYKTARMGAQAIGAILPKTDNRNMRNILVDKLSQYDDISDRASEELVRRGEEAKENPITEKMTDLMVQMKAGMNQDPSHLAEMLINGATMGIIDAEKAKNTAPGAEPVSHQLAGEVSGLCHKMIDEMKPFL